MSNILSRISDFASGVASGAVSGVVRHCPDAIATPAIYAYQTGIAAVTTPIFTAPVKTAKATALGTAGLVPVLGRKSVSLARGTLSLGVSTVRGTGRLIGSTAQFVRNHPKGTAAAALLTGAAVGALYATDTLNPSIDAALNLGKDYVVNPVLNRGQQVVSQVTTQVATNYPVYKKVVLDKTMPIVNAVADYGSHVLSQVSNKEAVGVIVAAAGYSAYSGAVGGKTVVEKAAAKKLREGGINFENTMDALLTPFKLNVGTRRERFPQPAEREPIARDRNGYITFEERHFRPGQAAFVVKINGEKVYGLRARNDKGEVKHIALQFIDGRIAVVSNGYRNIPHQLTQTQLNPRTLDQLANLGETNTTYRLCAISDETDFQNAMEQMLRNRRGSRC